MYLPLLYSVSTFAIEYLCLVQCVFYYAEYLCYTEFLPLLYSVLKFVIQCTYHYTACAPPVLDLPLRTWRSDTLTVSVQMDRAGLRAPPPCGSGSNVSAENAEPATTATALRHFSLQLEIEAHMVKGRHESMIIDLIIHML